jgi:hypothetical protein
MKPLFTDLEEGMTVFSKINGLIDFMETIGPKLLSFEQEFVSIISRIQALEALVVQATAIIENNSSTTQGKAS